MEIIIFLWGIKNTIQNRAEMPDFFVCFLFDPVRSSAMTEVTQSLKANSPNGFVFK